MVKSYLTAFIAGSSLPVFAMFFMAVANYKKEGIINFSYERYSLLAPFYFGMMSMFAIFLMRWMKISLQSAFFIVSIISVIFITSFIKYINVYKFKEQKMWNKQFVTVSLAHFFTYNIVIYLILKNIC